ncbi:NAD(P)-binding protein [Conidiobolus coronatus NRRL 28638]|uniref:NAD(P)-binding protein n=1 Tax=Conidiobolus coronatus (strain ATCC 28846 / CBS 209.66 / NRRL 28638) TaxID=796925 RepID=A0A137P8R8_CONC2|nr:NAD(P)-binding protein [Conidiobolus coronatus NRRL 28638]|eukprot:KXN71379.1 NAD(P)-binding protein [Conidiobolus coronatus NRRL 28638]
MKIKNTCSIVTGGSKGIGRAIVELLSAKGGNVIIGDILDKEGQELAISINRAGKSKTIFVYCDVRKSEDIKNLFKVATEEFGGAQIVFNNAGITEPSLSADNFDDYLSLFKTNLESVYTGTLLAIDHFNEQLKENPNKKFCIMNTGSESALTPVKELAFYSFTKNGITSLTNITSQLNWPNIRINCIAPSFTRTDILKAGKQDQSKILDLVYGLIEPFEVAQAMLELIEDGKSNGVVKFMQFGRSFNGKRVPFRLLKSEISQVLDKKKGTIKPKASKL